MKRVDRPVGCLCCAAAGHEVKEDKKITHPLSPAVPICLLLSISLSLPLLLFTFLLALFAWYPDRTREREREGRVVSRSLNADQTGLHSRLLRVYTIISERRWIYSKMYKWVGTVLTGTLCGWKMNETGSILPPEELLDCWLAVAQLGRDILLAFLWSLILLYTSAVVIKTVRLPVVATTVCQPVKSWHHDFRWLSALGLVVIHVAEVGEILLLDQNVPVLELCLPACNALVVLLSCVFFDRIEVSVSHFLNIPNTVYVLQ